MKVNKWVRRAVVAVLALLALWLVAWLAVPPILKSQVQKIASEKLGRQVTIGKIDFKPWTLELTVNDLRIASADGSHAQVEVGRLYADGELQSILRLAPVVDAVSVERPSVKVVRRKDGSYDFDDILQRFANQPEKPKTDPARFAIYNISLSGGSVDFDDQAIGPKHELRELALNVPFLSNFPSQREVKIEPKLAFSLNGSKFDSSAQATPFAEKRVADGNLQFTGLDLSHFLAYAPAGQPVKLAGGTLDANLKVDFEQGASEGLRISGTVAVHGAKVIDQKDRDLLAFDSLKVALANVRPLEGIVHIGEVELAAPQLAVARDAQGKLNLLPTDPASGDVEKPAEVSRPVAEATKGAIAKKTWQIQVDKVGLHAGKVAWRDAKVRPAAAVDVSQLEVVAEGVTWPMEKPASFHGSTSVAGAALKFKGEATDKVAKVEAEVDQLPLSLAAPYLAQSLEPTLDGKLSGQIDVAWNKPDLKLIARRVAADGLALTQGKTALASVGRFELTDAQVDMTQHKLTIANFSATNPKIRIERDSEKRWMFERWLKTGSPQAGGTEDAKVAAPKPAAAETPPPGANTKPWELLIGTLAINNGVVSYADSANEKIPVEVEFTALNLKAQQLSPNSTTASPIDVSGRLTSGRRADPGRFSYNGKFVLKPLSTEGKLELGSLPVHAFKAYFASNAPNVDLRRFFLSYRGSVQYASDPAGLKASLAGDTAFDDVRVNSALIAPGTASSLDRSASQLLSWKSLSLRGVKLNLVPKTPLALDVRETSLTDLFARLVIDENGKLHLQDLASRTPIDLSAPAAPGAAPAPPAVGPDGKPAATTRKKFFGRGTVTKSAQPVAKPQGAAPSAELMVNAPEAAAAPAPPAVADAPPVDTGPKPVINFGPITLVNARIDFTDRFIKPNYSADLSQMTGKLSAFSSRPVDGKPVLADLELNGKAQQTAALEIVGKLNPLVQPLQLDITAKMRDLELAPLSPYTIRYAGHGIERGKLSVDLNYKVEPDGRLSATNKLVLNQLQFGEEVPGAERTLPVKLAIALLADRNGVIDVDLPLSGSINDPQFSVWPLVWKGIVNLIVKAVTSPMNLLTGGSGGGGGESSAIVFDPGSSSLSPSAKESLDKVAKALTDRPALRMTVVGTASLEQERTAYQREQLRELARAEKRRIAVRGGKEASEVEAVTDAEYPALITAVYKRADFNKPRNMVGLSKDLPLPEMENLLMANIPVNDETIRELAVERGVVVRDYLLEQKLPAERLFLGAVETKPKDEKWKPGAELKLETR
ncbi:DUF748 domain-containing protein [Variovorax sp. J22R133]|uniref:DUF748 domain-containing protein n=1 Tax=Variovorax brevis TaxID=3053503 RepID=UPI002574D765|nr:DUF748 domain-containing protein [Variovorax sp. J22R133]MDM0112672.1 DUF748 domain-containing protein [Variovorax sp. J22R133]